MSNRILALVMGIAVTFFAGASNAADNPTVVIETSMGNIEVELNAGKAPETVKNFLAYVNDKFYDDTVFHRVMPTFMIQGGGFSKDLKEKPTKAPIKNESENGLKNEKGTIAMARLQDPHSANAQFFINVVDNAMLDRANSPDRWGYCVFGKVTAGMDVVNKIKDTPTGSAKGQTHGMSIDLDDVPKEPVIIKSITVKK